MISTRATIGSGRRPVQISQQGQGYAWTPGIYSQAQIDGWRKVTDAVHGAGLKIFIQLSMSCAAMISLQPGWLAGGAFRDCRESKPLSTVFAETSEPRALRLDEIPGLIVDYAKAAEHAKRAAFWVEIHGANGS